MSQSRSSGADLAIFQVEDCAITIWRKEDIMFLILGGIITAVLVGYIIITLITIATGERGGIPTLSL
jgi:hypothetical protein